MTQLYLICISILIYILILQFYTRFNTELFSTSQKKPYIWMYWDNKPGKTRPVYLDICLETIQKHCQQSYDTIHLHFAYKTDDSSSSFSYKSTIINYFCCTIK